MASASVGAVPPVLGTSSGGTGQDAPQQSRVQAFTMASSIPLQTYQDFCALELRKEKLFRAKNAFYNDLNEIVATLASTTKVTCGMGVLTNLTCLEAEKTAYLMIVAFALAMQNPVFIAWMRLNTKHIVAESITLVQNHLEQDVRKCLAKMVDLPEGNLAEGEGAEGNVAEGRGQKAM